jgi:hypothetical protein
MITTKKAAFDYKLGRWMQPALIRLLVILIAASEASIAIPAVQAEALRGETTVSCVNPASGASWQIKIDYEHSTVDSNPARISETEISWRDAMNGWKYTLDRKTGNLTVTLASATGGNFLYDRCRLEN